MYSHGQAMRSPKSNQTDSIQNISLPSTPKDRDRIACRERMVMQSFYQHVNEDSTVYKARCSKNTDSKRKATKNSKIEYHPLDATYDDVEGKSKIQLHQLNPCEIQYFQLVADNKVEELKTYLIEHPKLNINCINYQGVSALHIAVRNRSVEMVEFLLGQPHIDIGDTVLQAVRDNNVNILVLLLEAQKKLSPGLEFTGACHSAEFPGHVTPLLLAAQCGHYEIVAFLLSRGHTIARPHPPNCLCVTCNPLLDIGLSKCTPLSTIRGYSHPALASYLAKIFALPSLKVFYTTFADTRSPFENLCDFTELNSLINEDPLYASMTRLSVYRAVSSPAYIMHVSPDPILTALRLAEELTENVAANRQLAAAYVHLRNDVNAFAVDLIGCCRTSEEVELVLKQNTGHRGQRHFKLPRLLMAVYHKHKEFVAHPNTQQVLESYWLEDWHNWKYKSTMAKVPIVLSRIFLTPIILIMCMVLPRSSLVTHWQIPLNKLITHASAYIVFLALVFYISNQDKTEQKRGPPDTGAEAPLILYVCGYTWSAIRMCLMQGPQRYFTAMWNWAEVIMLALFGVTFALWIAAAVEAATAEDDLERKYWDQHDPTLLAEGTFCLATIFAYFRLMYLCQLNYHLGPLQVSLGKMAVDIYKYIIVFAIIISAFAAGLSRFYQYYDGMVYEDEFGVKTVQVSSFTGLTDTLKTLFWGLFCMAPLESADVVLANTRSSNHDKGLGNRHGYTELIGYFCFGSFEVISVIVVLNMLIATMSNTFQKVNDNVAIEWTFGRTEVYIYYMMQTTLPSPFNLIPTTSGMASVVDWLRARFGRPQGIYARWSPSHCCYIERDFDSGTQKDYPALISVLIQRYFRDKQTTSMANGGIEAELESLRRELAAYKLVAEKNILVE